MRLLKLVLGLALAALAVTLGLFAVIVVAVGVIAYFLGRAVLRRFGSPRQPPAVPPGTAPHARTRDLRRSEDIIEVTATEVRGDHTAR